MGWCSGTTLFDKVVGVVISLEISRERQVDIITALADSMENNDWDCQSDSFYYNHPVVKEVFKTLHPSWFEYTKEDILHKIKYFRDNVPPHQRLNDRYEEAVNLLSDIQEFLEKDNG